MGPVVDTSSCSATEDRAHSDIAEHRVTVNPDNPITVILGDGGYLIYQVTFEDSTEELNARSLRHNDIHIPPNCIRVDHDDARSALYMPEVDRHIAEEGDRRQLVLDVPGVCALAPPASLEERIQADQPSTGRPGGRSVLALVRDGTPSLATTIRRLGSLGPRSELLAQTRRVVLF